MRINTKLTIGLLVLLFLAVWVTALFTLFFDTFEVRERHAGLIADSIINNRLVMPLLNYQYLSEKGDALVAGIAAVPFFLVLGPGYLSLKLTALFITVSTLVLWLAFARKYYGYLAMLFFGLFFIFSPPSFTKASLMSWGFHSQANLFIILSLLMFSYLNFDKKGNGPKYLYLFLGLACGFGLYSVKIFAVFLAALIIFWFFIEKNFFLKFKFYVFLAGFAVGYSPGALYNIRGGKYLVQVTDMPLWKFYFDNFLLRLKGVISTVFVDLPASFMFSGPGNWANYLYFGLFLFCMAVMYFGAPDKKGDAKKALFRFMVFYLFLFAVALNFCPHTLEPKYAGLGYRYLVAVYPFMFLGLAAGFSRLFDNAKRKPALICFACILFVLFAAFGNLNRIDFSSSNNMLSYKGASYARLGWVIGEAYLDKKGKGLEQCIEIIGKTPENERNITYEGLGFALYTNFGLRSPEEIEKVPVQYRPWAYKGFGEMCVWGFIHEEDPDKLWSCIKLIPKEYLPYFITGFARAVSLEFLLDFTKSRDFFLSYFPEKELKYLYQGFGEAAGEWFGDLAEQRIKVTDGAFKEFLLEGIEEGKKRSLKPGKRYGE